MTILDPDLERWRQVAIMIRDRLGQQGLALQQPGRVDAPVADPDGGGRGPGQRRLCGAAELGSGARHGHPYARSARVDPEHMCRIVHRLSRTRVSPA